MSEISTNTLWNQVDRSKALLLNYIRILKNVPKDRQKPPIMAKTGQEVNKKPIKTGKNRVYHYVIVEDKLILIINNKE